MLSDVCNRGRRGMVVSERDGELHQNPEDAGVAEVGWRHQGQERRSSGIIYVSKLTGR